MGSHFTNDDLVRESRFLDDYACSFVTRPGDAGQGLYVVGCSSPSPTSLAYQAR